jgi:hypothetical protein
MSFSRKDINRRTLLRGAGGAALALPWMEVFTGGKAQAATNKRRFIGYYSPSGFEVGRFKPASMTATSYTPQPNSWLQVFEPIKQDVLLVDGAPYNSARDPACTAIGHPRGSSGALTGSWTTTARGDGASTASEMESIDTTIAKAIGKATKFPAYYLGILPGSKMGTFLAGKDQAIPPVADPWVAHNQLFSTLPAPAATRAPTATPATPDRRAINRKRVVDAVLAEYKGLRCTLGSEDRHRLDQHVTSLQEIEQRLAMVDSPLNPASGPTAACASPGTDKKPKIAPMDPGNVPMISRLQTDIAAMALACDLTRVLGMQVDGIGAGRPGLMASWLPGVSLAIHHISHLRGGNPKEALNAVHTWQAKEILYLVEKLKQIPEEGGTVWDNTLIYWHSEVGSGWTHSMYDVIHQVIGGKGYFKTGRYVDFGGGPTNSHNRLLVHFLNYMGIPATSFGSPKYCMEGPFPGLTV